MSGLFIAGRYTYNGETKGYQVLNSHLNIHNVSFRRHQAFMVTCINPTKTHIFHYFSQGLKSLFNAPFLLWSCLSKFLQKIFVRHNLGGEGNTNNHYHPLEP